MLEKKFNDLVDSFLRGEASSVEMTWIADDLKERRERRDLFSEKAAAFLLEAKEEEGGTSESKLGDLLLRDLSTIEGRDLELAMPRRGRSIGGSTKLSEPSEGAVSRRRRPIRTSTRLEVTEEHSMPEEKISYVLPVLAVLAIIITFLVMIRFSSLERDKIEAAEKEEESTRSFGAAFLEATDFMVENHLMDEEVSDESNAQGLNGGENLLELNEPASLADLVGEGRGNDSDSINEASDESLLILRNE